MIASAAATEVDLRFDASVPQLAFADEELHTAASQTRHATGARIEITIAPPSSDSAGFNIVSDGCSVHVTGANAIEAM